jgi:hypothetical protein
MEFAVKVFPFRQKVVIFEVVDNVGLTTEHEVKVEIDKKVIGHKTPSPKAKANKTLLIFMIYKYISIIIYFNFSIK